MGESKPEDYDFRLQAVTMLAADFTSPNSGAVHKAGTVVTVGGSVRYDSTHTLHFNLPNVTALFLDQAYVAWAASETLLRQEEFLASPSRLMPAGTILPKDDAAFFALLEQRMVAIVFAYTALESFANESIPEGHVYRELRQDRRYTEEYTKDQAERLRACFGYTST